MNVNMRFSPSYFSHIHFLFNPSLAFNFFLLNLECIHNRVLLYIAQGTISNLLG